MYKPSVTVYCTEIREYANTNKKVKSENVMRKKSSKRKVYHAHSF